MADVGASVAVKMIRGLRCHEEKIKEVADYVASLLTTLRRTQWLLNHSHLIEKFAQDEEYIRYTADEIDDVLDTFVVDVAVMLQKNEAGYIKRFLTKIFSVQSDGFVLKNIKANISKLVYCTVDEFQGEYFSAIGNIRDEQWAATQDQRWLRQLYPRGIKEHFVGMDDEFEELDYLVVDCKTPVISIWGVSGLGKTTIASKIYKHRRVRSRFNAFAWVSFSHGCQISTLLLDILRQLSPRLMIDETSKVETVIKELKEVQSWSYCFIVLDNIEDMDQWTQLIPALEMEGRQSVILLTTREENIANRVGHPHKLRLLNEDEAWDLLKKHAFPNNDGPDAGLFPRLGKEMVRKCGYLPSTITKLGRILRSKVSLGDWQMINNNVSEYIQDHQIEGNEQLIMSSLDSDYASLPYYLKQCFIYLGNFSKDEEIDVEDLYFLWIAEGIVSSANKVTKRTMLGLVNGENTAQDIANEDMEETTQDIAIGYREERVLDIRNEEEKTLDIANIDWFEIMKKDIANEDREEPALDIAEKYLTELDSRGVVRVRRDELSATRRSQSCFLCSPAQQLFSWEEEKKGFRQCIIDICNGKQPTFDYYTHRRLAIHFNQQAELDESDLTSMEHLRSLFLLNSSNKSVESPLEITDYRKFKLLRVLNFVRCKFDGRKLPKGIDRLLNLRYLGLLYCDLDELPSSISNLRNLRVLNVRVLKNYLLRIPNVLHKLVLLNHLRLPYCTDREQIQKLILGGLLELETLFGFNSLIHDLDTLSKLDKLRLLGAHVYSNNSLKSLLRFITSHGARIRTKLFIENTCDFTSKEGVDVLQDVLMCPNLHALTLSMVLIYKVPDCGQYFSSDLTQLKLIGCKVTEDPMEALGKFPNLQKLCLGHGAFLGREMTVQANGFPNLAYFEIRSLPYFEEWKVDEGAMRNLSELIIRRCPRLKMIPDGLESISNLKNMEIELAAEAFVDVSEEEYRQKFHFVPTLNIRRVGLSSDQLEWFPVEDQ